MEAIRDFLTGEWCDDMIWFIVYKNLCLLHKEHNERGEKSREVANEWL